MKINPDFVAPCGLYCGVCAIYIAHRDNNQKFKEWLVNLYKGEVLGKGTLPNSENLSAQDIRCNGCLSVMNMREIYLIWSSVAVLGLVVMATVKIFP